MATGTVKWFNPRKGFGMIAPIDGSQDVLVHQSAITNDERPLSEGQVVEFETVPGKNGPRAQTVRTLA